MSETIKADFKEEAELFQEFCKTIAAIWERCPWVNEQSHQSLNRYLIEEAYEAAEAFLGVDKVQQHRELGDVLLQVVLHGIIAGQHREFSIKDIIKSINKKMIDRHPHVFVDKNSKITAKEVRERWEELKSKEKNKAVDVMSEFANIPKIFPASKQAQSIGKVTARLRFDWENQKQVFNQLKSEIDELETAFAENDKKHIEEELGDVFFTLAQFARHCDLDAEMVALQANLKFMRRFEQMQLLIKERNQSWKELSTAELEVLWRDAKEKLRSKPITSDQSS